MSLAADNGTHQVVSGPEAAIEALLKTFEEDGLRVDRLRASDAFHSALMDPALADLEAAAPEAAAPSVRLVSDVSGRVLEGAPDGAYWRRQAREPVQFAKALRTLADLEAGLLVEIGASWRPRSDGGARLAPRRGAYGDPEPAAQRARGLRRRGGGSLRGGARNCLRGPVVGERRRRVSLPAYPFQRERYWTSASPRQPSGDGHALLGVQRDSADGEHSFERQLHSLDPAWLSDYRVFGNVVAPGALYAAQVGRSAS